MKKPVVLWLVQAALLLISASYALVALAAIAGLFQGKLSPQQSGPALIIGAALALGAALLLAMSARQSVSRRTIVLFLWAVLFIYPATNVLIQAGWFPPKAPIPDNQLGGAAIAEALRYISLLTLIVWLSFTKSAIAYLAANRSTQAANSA